MARPKKMQVGMMVEFAQPRLGEKVWLPFMVTHVYEDGRISGVCFSGEPGALGWMNRAAQAFDKREMGSTIGQYRVKGAPQMEDAPEPEPAMMMDEPEAEPMEDLQEGDAAEDDDEPFGGQ